MRIVCACSAAKKAKPAFPSGLVTNWKAKTTSGSRKPQGRAAEPNDRQEPVVGGLNDDDAAAVQPDFSTNVRSNLKGRKNNVRQLFVYLRNKGLTIFT